LGGKNFNLSDCILFGAINETLFAEEILLRDWCKEWWIARLGSSLRWIVQIGVVAK